MTDLPGTITENYDVKDHGREWHLYCKKCDQGWALKKPATGEVAVGNTLHLLNHARSHLTRKTTKR